MAIARSNRIRLVYTAVTVAASAIVIGSGGAVSAASHAATVGQPPPEWAELSLGWDSGPAIKGYEEFVQLSRSSDLIQMIARLDETLISS